MFKQSSSPSERTIKWPKTEHKMAKNGWKLSKVAITGSTRSLRPKTGDSGCWLIRYDQQHSLRLLFSGTYFLTSRARSLRNLLVSGNECGRVFPAGVGPGSPSRDAANWLPSRFSLSVETRRRYGWLRMMVFPGARLFPSPNLVPFGRVAARERQGALSRRAW